jgi:hypothetical protein
LELILKLKTLNSHVSFITDDYPLLILLLLLRIRATPGLKNAEHRRIRATPGLKNAENLLPPLLSKRWDKSGYATVKIGPGET